MLDTLIFDPTPCGFPKPRVPLLPTLGGVSPRPTFAAKKCWAPKDHFRSFTRARYALREAYRLSGVEPDTALLAPSYHCRTMLDPALVLGGEVILYPLRPNLSPDLAAIETLATNSAIAVKALLATHFFGFPKDFAALADWCRQSRITLIADCSHVLFLEQYRATATGQYGEFVTSSPYKFLPSQDGGLLYARNSADLIGVANRAALFVRELGGIADIMRSSQASSQTSELRPSDGDDIASEAILARGRETVERAGTSADYQLSQQHTAALWLSKFIARHSPINEIITRRRHNYRVWADAIAGIPTCHALYPELSTDCIPYMFPLYVDRPDPHFYQLKRLGMPIWRWDSLALSSCATAADYRSHLLQLPCHQSLSPGQLEWMTSTVKRVLIT